jgi:hypothetical protein
MFDPALTTRRGVGGSSVMAKMAKRPRIVRSWRVAAAVLAVTLAASGAAAASASASADASSAAPYPCPAGGGRTLHRE